MTFWLLPRSIRRAPRRFVLAAIGVAFPVAVLAATLLFVDNAVQAMTPAALRPVQVEMRAVGKSLGVDMAAAADGMRRVPDVRMVEPFAATRVVVAPGTSGQVTARLFAVDPAYLDHHPWVRPVTGRLEGGVLLDQSLSSTPGLAGATSVTIGLPGDAPELSLQLPVNGTVDLREAKTWFSIPYGEVQGDLVAVPRAIVIDYDTFTRAVLPVLQTWASQDGLPAFDPGSDELPAASLETHITVDHAAYPSDPGIALTWSGQLQKILGRAAGADVVVADNAADALLLNQEDALNAKILFLLLGIPGVLVAGALGIATSSTLVEAHRREEALLRMRGATSGQLARLATAEAALEGLVGSVAGLLIAAVAVSVVVGRPVWQGVPAEGLAASALLAVAAGLVTTAARVVRLRRASRRSEDAVERRAVRIGWAPAWRRLRLDVVAIVAGTGILMVNFASGGLKQTPIEGQSLALSFYVLLAPIAIWLGATLLLIRVVMGLLDRWARPERSARSRSWLTASLRWFARRPAQTAVALALGTLAVAFGTSVATFAATYDTARHDDAQAAIAADLRLTPGDPTFVLPPLGADIVSVSPVHLVPARVETDRKTILAIDLASYTAATGVAPRMVTGGGPEALAQDPSGVLVDTDIAESFAVGPGDFLPVTIFPDDFENAADLELRVVGVFAAFPPTSAAAELVTALGTLPRADLVPPDFYLAHVAAGRAPADVAAALRNDLPAETFRVETAAEPNQRGLTALDLLGLGAIESIAAALVAAVGVAVLGAFLILERRREYAILHTIGADRRQVLTAPALEGAFAVLGSILIGVPIGIGLGALEVRVLGLFFALPPPLVTVPVVPLAILVLLIGAASVLALGGALVAVSRMRVASVLRES